jgi:hypothetical protein
MSTDAPYTDEDARYWDCVLTGLLAAVAIGVIVWSCSANGYIPNRTSRVIP